MAGWEDKEDQYTEQINAAHPVAGGSDERYARALAMVENRNSKYALVDLVNWLLARAEEAEGRLCGGQVGRLAPSKKT